MIGRSPRPWVGFTSICPACSTSRSPWSPGFAGGALWGGIAGFLKARTGAHEVITTIMLNFIALRAARLHAVDRRPSSGPAAPIRSPSPWHESAELPELPVTSASTWARPRPRRGRRRLVAALPLDDRVPVAGRRRQPRGGRYAGMSVGATYVAGDGSWPAGSPGWRAPLNILGVQKLSLLRASRDIGFDAIALALLGRTNPAGVVAACAPVRRSPGRLPRHAGRDVGRRSTSSSSSRR